MRICLQSILLLLLILVGLSSCRKDVDLTDIEYNPQEFRIAIPATDPPYPQLEIPADNPMTIDGVALGRALFYDPILSADGTMSCASCHKQELSFTDGLAVSTGIDNIAGTRSSMSLLDIGFFYRGLFWDGSVSTLEEQALLPVEDPIELHNQWPDVVEKFREHETYPELFRKAFGIESDADITKELAAKAIAQFERTLVSSGNSKYDRVISSATDIFTDQEQMGFEIFFSEGLTGFPDGQCFHCHGAPMLTDNSFRNNGIDEALDSLDFKDLGRGVATGSSADNGQFRTTSLRNIEHTAPYMHDGRFATLEEVMDHYSSGGENSWGKDPLILDIKLNEEEKAAVIAFLKTLSDEDFLTNPAYSNPN